MKKINIILLFLATFLLFSRCTKKFDDFNTNPYGLYKDDLNADYNYLGAPFGQVQLSIYDFSPAWATQLQQNLIADIYSGYMSTPTPFRGNNNNTTYGLVSGWNVFPWQIAYTQVMPNILAIKKLTRDQNKSLDFYAWSLILKVEAMHRVSDIYGPIIYSKFGQVNADGSVDYDSQADAYNHFFSDLDSAITLLTPFANMEKSKAIVVFPFTKFDKVYGGSYVEWLKFANTLRLRLALRIVKADPSTAKLQGEAALSNSFGLLSDNTDNFIMDIGNTNHPLNVISGSWGDIRLGANVESILKGYSDPRLSAYAKPASDPLVTGQIKGIRSGINIDGKSRYENYSSLPNFASKIQLMTAAEAWFLKSEAALRNWANAGDAAMNYNKGITISFDQYGLPGASNYLMDNVKSAAQYLDPEALNPGENDVLIGNPNLSKVTIMWNNSDAFEKSLERIITQKWIAMYPEGQEAWSEFRRTGYPKLFPVIVNNSQGTITGFIKRIPFSSAEYSTNNAGVTKALTLLNGPDTGGTPLWWNK